LIFTLIGIWVKNWIRESSGTEMEGRCIMRDLVRTKHRGKDTQRDIDGDLGKAK